MTSDRDEHTHSLGALFSNYQSLEFVLRAFLTNIYDLDSQGEVPGMPNLFDLQVGNIVPVNNITNFDPLGKLIDKYNAYVITRDSSLEIDRHLVDIRDALAHGRVSGITPDHPLNILKFDKPKNGQAKVVFSQTMNAEWFNIQIQFVLDSIKLVSKACKKFTPGMLD